MTIGLGQFCTGSEMGHLFNVDGISLSSPGLFINVQGGGHWSATPFDETLSWNFGFSAGFQNFLGSGNTRHVWAVRSGDVGGAAPEPASAGLFGSALGVLGWIRRGRAVRLV